TSIQKNALVAVDVSNFGFAASCRSVAGIVSKHPGLCVKLADVDYCRSNSSFKNRERILLVANDEFAGLDIGAGFRIHDKTSLLPAADFFCSLNIYAAKTLADAVGVADPWLHCKMRSTQAICICASPQRTGEAFRLDADFLALRAGADHESDTCSPPFQAPTARRR